MTHSFPEILRALWVSSRPLSWINTAVPFAIAYFLATGTLDMVGIIGTLFFLGPYNLAMYGINDVFDYESDMRNPRKGGVEGAVLAKSLHSVTLWAAGLSCAPFVLYLAFQGSAAALLTLFISMFAVVAYSAKYLRFKEKPLLDSLTSATHFVSPAVYAWVLAGQEFDRPVLLALVAFFLWAMASHAFGAVQDIHADREAGLSSIATAFGARTTVWCALSWYVIAAVCAFGLPFPASGAAFALVPYIIAVIPFVRVTDATAETTRLGWQYFLSLNFLAGFLITQMVIWINIFG